MNKFKAFLTFVGFFWLLVCGFWALFSMLWGADSRTTAAWIGLLINAWALPVWMLLRYLLPGKISGDLREPGAFAGVLLGLALVLLADSSRGLPVHLAIYNLFVFLLYLYHLSSVAWPTMPARETLFPDIEEMNMGGWRVAEYCRDRDIKGAIVLFLRGSYCADSRNQLHQLHALQEELQRKKVGLVLWSVQPTDRWPHRLLAGEQYMNTLQVRQLAPPLPELFVATNAAPILLWPWVKDAARPSAWLVNAEGYILWRELAANYRTPVTAANLRGQLFRLQE
ncbi:hypothetical protein [Microbulbifer pacificus]|uniref:hypothetical protein n=1 Tax=Microbulbifer pacificus TaxID=407164 RepID=UPI000CF41C6F|nr:hypothetical protein [Microbulbifer pacificus]